MEVFRPDGFKQCSFLISAGQTRGVDTSSPGAAGTTPQGCAINPIQSGLEFVGIEISIVGPTNPDPVARYVYFPHFGEGGAADFENFYRPYDLITGTPDVDLNTFSASGGEIVVEARVGSAAFQSGQPYQTFEAVLGDRYVMPYDYDTYCDAAGCEPQEAAEKPFFLARVGHLPSTGSPFTPAAPRVYEFSDVADTKIPAGWNGPWDLPGGMTALFGAGRSLQVDGVLSGDGVTFTASDPAAGWTGLRFGPGSGGTLSDVTITRVGGWGNHAVRINNASPTFDDVRILDPRQPSAVAGIYVTGSGSSSNFHELTIRDFSYGGVTITNGAEVRMTNSTVANSGTGLAARSYGTDVFLYPALDGGPRTQGNQFLNNPGGGVVSSAGGYVTFGRYYYSNGGAHNDGFNSVTGSGQPGVQAGGNATLAAGSSNGNGRNRFFGNAGDDARASDYGSTVQARCNWWDDTTPPFRTSATNGATLDDSRWLLADPEQDSTAACVNTAPAGAQARTASAPGPSGASVRRDRLDAVAGLQDRPAAAVAALASLVASAADSPEAASALSMAGHLAVRGPAPGARGLLARHASRPGPLRSVARRALVGLDHARGDLAAALAGADALLAAPDAEADVAFAYLERVYLLSELGRDAEARRAALALAAAAPGSTEARLARDHLELPYRDALDQTGARAMAAVTPAAVEVAAVYPNPASASATVAFTLEADAAVEVAVYDVLGRRVAEARAEHSAGPGRESVDVSALAPGAYLVRVEAGGAVATRRLTVAR